MWVLDKFTTWRDSSADTSLYSDMFNFEKEKIEFSCRNCYALAQLCGQAYHLDRKIIKSWGFQYKQIDIESSSCTIFWNDESCFIAFAGTDSISDLIRDMAIEGIHWNEVSYVHKGFYDTAMKIYKPLINFLEKMNLFDRPMWLTGHSLGAAQCILTALMLFEEREEFSKGMIRGIYTFAQPKVGGPFFVKKAHEILSNRFFRIVNEGDLIPYLPDKGFLPEREFKYEHLKTTYLLYNEKGAMQWCNTKEEIEKLPNLVKIMQRYQRDILELQKSMEALDIPQVIDYNSRFFFQTIAFFLDHAVEIYIEKAKKNA